MEICSRTPDSPKKLGKAKQQSPLQLLIESQGLDKELNGTVHTKHMQRLRFVPWHYIFHLPKQPGTDSTGVP